VSGRTPKDEADSRPSSDEAFWLQSTPELVAFLRTAHKLDDVMEWARKSGHRGREWVHNALAWLEMRGLVVKYKPGNAKKSVWQAVPESEVVRRPVEEAPPLDNRSFPTVRRLEDLPVRPALPPELLGPVRRDAVLPPVRSAPPRPVVAAAPPPAPVESDADGEDLEDADDLHDADATELDEAEPPPATSTPPPRTFAAVRTTARRGGPHAARTRHRRHQDRHRAALP
jgi:hypothetical protein